ncbi:MAG: leucine-rich repeat protein [Clostridia bacterium]|nr:leucine-rich repeat protein [Clostridia bacterium]
MALIVIVAALLILSYEATKKYAIYTVKFFVDGEQQGEFSEHYGVEIDFPEIESPDENGNVFIGWFTSPKYDSWFTSTKVTKNINIYGYWIPYEDSLVTVTFYDDDNGIIDGYPIQVQIGSFIESYPLPDTDDGYRLDAWMVDGKAFDFNSRVLTDLEFYPTRKPAVYTVEFKSLDDVISTQTYTVENYNIKVPSCPDRDHYYAGEWESFELTMGDITVNAIYEPIPYTVQYVDGSGTVLATIDYTVLTYMDVVPPDPTPVPGCYSYFDDLECGDTILHQKVKALDYVIEYFVNDELVATYNTNIFDYYKLVPPEIPQIPGYESSWEKYKLQLETNIRVNAVYDLITYYVSFTADNKVVEVAEYNVENTEVEIPELPEKAGYTCRWEDFYPVIGDITVNALFTPINYNVNFVLFDELIETELELTYTTTFNAERMTINLPDSDNYPNVSGCGVKWDVPKRLPFEDIVISGYYYDIDYTYLNFVQVVEYDDEENVTDRSFYVTESPDTQAQDNIVIPDKYHNIPVTHIEPYAFVNGKFQTVEIYAIERIGEFAFSCCNLLQSAILHDGVKIIENNVFDNCSKLTTISLPETVSRIDESAFAATGLISVTLPAGLEVISSNLFYSCLNLEKIAIPASVKQISTYAFYGCKSLTSVTISSGVEVIYRYAFAYCLSLKEIVIPESTSLIESYVFDGCSSLSSVKILGDGTNWYFFRNHDINSLQQLPQDIFTTGEDLADTIVATPSFGFYKKPD